MALEFLESCPERILVLRERNEQIRQALEREVARFTLLRSHRNKHNGARATSSQLNELTPRELEVLRCIAEGNSTKETAARLGMSFKTAACHRHRIMQKVGVHSTGALVRFAISHRVVKLPIQS
jgi:DNA-binding NarL/FixJ family response regulator